jgi:Icc-related predicted phosphoesterase
MKVSHASDLHLEFMDFPDFSKEDGGDVLILNGDILVAPYLDGQRTDQQARKVQKYLKEHFIPDLIEKYDQVLYLAGNHEFYRSDITTGLGTIEDWFQDRGVKNIMFMENDVISINGVKFVGATLWSDFLGADPVAMWEAGRGMNDFRIIKDGKHENGRDRIFTPERALELHKKSLAFIVDETKEDVDTVVLTHHAPHASMLNRFHAGNILDGAYYTDLTWLMNERPNILRWISGHTHGIYENKVNETLCVSNCRGYYTELGFKSWTGLKHFEV